MRIIIIGLVFISAVGALIWLALMAGSIPHYQIHEVKAAAYRGEECRLDGTKVLEIENKVNPLRFVIKSESGDTLTVVSSSHPPDNFKTGGGVGLRGYYLKDQEVFEASDVTTSCPSKYEGEENQAKYGTEKPKLEVPGLTDSPQTDSPQTESTQKPFPLKPSPQQQ